MRKEAESKGKLESDFYCRFCGG